MYVHVYIYVCMCMCVCVFASRVLCDGLKSLTCLHHPSIRDTSIFTKCGIGASILRSGGIERV